MDVCNVRVSALFVVYRQGCWPWKPDNKAALTANSPVTDCRKHFKRTKTIRALIGALHFDVLQEYFCSIFQRSFILTYNSGANCLSHMNNLHRSRDIACRDCSIDCAINCVEHFMPQKLLPAHSRNKSTGTVGDLQLSTENTDEGLKLRCRIPYLISLSIGFLSGDPSLRRRVSVVWS